MAVVDKYADPNIATPKYPTTALRNMGGSEMVAITTFEVAAADDDGSTYRLFANVPLSIVPISLAILNDAITAGTVYDIGLYSPKNGAVITNPASTTLEALFASALDLSTGHSNRSSPLDGLGAVDIADSGAGKSLWELMGYSLTPTPNRPWSADIVMTADTVGSAAGTVTAIFRYFNI